MLGGKEDMSKAKKKNWLIITKGGWVSPPIRKREAKSFFKNGADIVRYAVHIKKERKFNV